jgi:predicted metal-dependent phosphoesterase TrpH
MATVADILARVEREGALQVIAFTEHDTIQASDDARDLHARGHFSFDIVPGMEVTTLDGHLLALFVQEAVPSFTRIEQALAEVHRQGGLAIVPHPLSWLTRSVKASVFDRVAAANRNDGVFFDGIEEHNMSPAGRATSAKARTLNRSKLNLAPLGASDAHFLEAVGSGHTEFLGATADDLRAAIAAGTTVARPGRHPSMRELGYHNVALQSWRGMMATPRALGWGPTIRSFFTSHLRAPKTQGAQGPRQ